MEKYGRFVVVHGAAKTSGMSLDSYSQLCIQCVRVYGERRGGGSVS